MSKKFINFGSGWNKLDDSGDFKHISVATEHTKNLKQNKTASGSLQGYKLFVAAVDSTGELLEQPLEVKSFFLKPSGADRQKFPTAPEYQATLIVE